jgi:hypothetical protein
VHFIFYSILQYCPSLPPDFPAEFVDRYFVTTQLLFLLRYFLHPSMVRNKGGGQAGQIFQAGARWPAGDSVSGQFETSPGTDPCGVGRPSGPLTAAGRRTGLQTLQPGIVFPGTPARLFTNPGWSRWRRSLAGGHVAACIIIVLHV